jgi:four helix bundle protein
MKDDTERQDLRVRTKDFALAVVKLYVALPKTGEAQVLGRQLLRSGTSVGAHYHEAVRARSTAEYVSKLGGALQELEETSYWLELLERAEIVFCSRPVDLPREVNELTAILVSCMQKAKSKRSSSPTEP